MAQTVLSKRCIESVLDECAAAQPSDAPVATSMHRMYFRPKTLTMWFLLLTF